MYRRRARSAILATALAVVAVMAANDVSFASTPDVFLQAVGSTSLQDQGFAGAGTTVAIIDSGIASVPALDGVVVHQENMSAAPDEGDQFGHGTFVAGIVHATAPAAKIVSVKLSGADGSVDVSQVLAALQWVVLNRDRYNIKVVNLSFGNDSKQSWHVSPLNYAVQRAWDAGIVVVVAAGNAGPLNGTVTKPGDDPVAISVGASDDNGTTALGDDTIPDFVSRGPTPDGLAKADLVAPGTHIESLRAPGSTIDTSHPEARVGDAGFRGSGTSFATPIVAGIAAQMLSADASLSPDQVKYGLIQGAQQIDGDATAQGTGSVRAGRALQLATSGRANQGVGRSTGYGSLNEARGSMHVLVKAHLQLVTGLDDPTAVSITLPVDGEDIARTDTTVPLLEPVTAAVHTFDHDQFTNDANWNASQWGASQWGASQWGASQWGASQWGASQWGASQWWASQWG